LNGIHISRLVECQLKMMNIQGDQAPAKWQKILKKFENSSTKTIVKHRKTPVRISYGLPQKFPQKIWTCTAPSSWQCTHPHIPENHSVCD
jgi:hypothetical protein